MQFHTFERRKGAINISNDAAAGSVECASPVRTRLGRAEVTMRFQDYVRFQSTCNLILRGALTGRKDPRSRNVHPRRHPTPMTMVKTRSR